jgi:hypothetical protein
MRCNVCSGNVDVAVVFEDRRVCRPCRDFLRTSAVAQVGPLPSPAFDFTIVNWTRQIDAQLKKNVLDMI